MNFFKKFLINQSSLFKSILAFTVDLSIYFFIYFIFKNRFEIINQEILFYALFVFLNSTFLFLSGHYKDKIQFTGVNSTYSLIKSSFVIIALLNLLFFIIEGHISFFLIIAPFNVAAIIALIRLVVSKFLYNQDNKYNKNILIYGAGNAGVQLLRNILQVQKYNMIGFIDDSTDKSNRTIDNYKIYNPDLIEKLVLKYNVEILFIAIPSASFSRRKLILKDLIDKELNVKIKILPGLDSLIDKNINFNLMEDISIEDIIGREIVPPVKHLIEKNILNKTILITGAAGTIGSELCRKILEIGPKKLIAIDSSEIGLFNLIKKCNDYDSEKFFLLGDLKDKRFIKKFLNDYPNIDTIYHVAAYKHVNIVESNKLSGFYNNVVIINNLISAIQDKGIKKFINVSTDKAVNPTSIMGLSKYFCELIVNEYSKKTDIEFSIVRFGNVLKSSGSVLTIFDEQIKNLQPITVTDKNVKRYFMTVEEAVSLIIQSSSLKGKNRTFVLDMGDQFKIYEIAKKMIIMNGFSIRNKDNPDGDITIKITGLQKGEKMGEALFLENAQLIKTEHPKIFRINENFLSLDVENFFNFLDRNYDNNNDTFLDEWIHKGKKGIKI